MIRETRSIREMKGGEALVWECGSSQGGAVVGFYRSIFVVDRLLPKFVLFSLRHGNVSGCPEG